MEKTYKYIFIALSYILVFTIFLSIFAIPIQANSGKNSNLLSSADIVDSIKNLELNLTSVIYVQNSKGDWVEYQRLHGDENRIWASIDKMPKMLQDAFIAIEDETFYDHSGINWKRTVGAVSNYFFKFDDTEFGGSTITQQLIKNVTMDKGKNALRKIREIGRAIIVEKQLKKKEILEAYLNTIALGNGICGVSVAANYYFNKDVNELTLVECASLAAITQNPSRYNPVSQMENNKIRRNTVLQKMLELGFINEEEFNSAYDKDISLDDTQEETYEAEINNYFVDALIDQVIKDLAEKYQCTEDIASTMLYNGGYKIYSTLKTDIQESMESVYEDTDKYFKLKGKNLQGETVHVQSAMTIMDYEGHIVGLVGGAGEKTVNRGLNRAIDSPRQPGSTMKPLGVYALAVDTDLVHYSSIVKDEPIKNYYPDGKKGPKEWYGYYKGNITIDYAIRKSANTIPVILLKDIGIDKSFDFLTNKLGCKHLVEGDKNLASLALGGCIYGLTTTESAAAYAIFGNNGVYHKPTTYYKIEKVNGEVVIDYDEKGEQVISPASATIMNKLLQGVVYGSEGTGSGIRSFSSMKAFAKTGTSSESNDLWMVAGSPYYVGSVWYGFDKQQQINSTSAAATVWRDVMKKVHKNLEKKTFEESEDVYKKGSGYYKEGTTPDNISLSSGAESTDQTPQSQVTPPTVSSTESTTVSSETQTPSSEVSSSVSSDTVTTPEETTPPDNSENTVPSKPTTTESENSSNNETT